MSDFFTKKQKKYWCDICRIFMEYNKLKIDAHNKSNIHLHNLNSNKRYNDYKKKYNNYLNDLNEKNNKNFIGNKTQRLQQIESYNAFNEVKNEIITNQINSNKKDNLPKINLIPKERKWGVYYDTYYQLPFYYNYQSKESVWEKPKSFDGNEKEIKFIIEEGERIVKEKLKDEGKIGEWEFVQGKQSIFGIKKDKFIEEEKLKEKNNKKSNEEIIEENKKKDIILKENNMRREIQDNKKKSFIEIDLKNK